MRFSGHEHDLEHFTERSENGANVHYILNGAVDIIKNITDHIDKVPVDSLKFHWSNDFHVHGAVCFVKATIKEMTVEFLETSGKLLHQILIPNQWL